MQEWIINILEQFGYLGLFLMMTLENVFPPIPSEIILPFAGFMTTYSALTLLGVIVAATIGSVIGAMILYSVGLTIDSERIEKIIDRYGRLLRLKNNDFDRIENWFLKYGYLTIFFGRMIPLVRSLISLPAGMVRMRLTVFLPLTLLGTLLWNTLLIYIGFILAENWTSILDFMGYYSKVTYLTLVILFVVTVFWKIRKNKKHS